MMAGHERADGREELVLPNGVTVVGDNFLPYLQAACRAYDLEHLGLVISGFSSMRVLAKEKLHEYLLAAGIEPSALLRDYQMALVLLLAAGDKERTDPGGRRITAIELARLCRLAISSHTTGEDQSDGASLVRRTAYQQFWDLESFDVFPRGMIMLREVSDLIPDEDSTWTRPSRRPSVFPFPPSLCLAFPYSHLLRASPQGASVQISYSALLTLIFPLEKLSRSSITSAAIYPLIRSARTMPGFKFPGSSCTA